jgi:hypothetical protein
MRPTTTAILMSAMLAAGIAGTADAKRLGGGKTSGVAKPEVNTSISSSAPKAAPAPAPAAAPSATKKVIAGAAVGAAAGVVAGAALANAGSAQAAAPAAGDQPSATPAATSATLAASEARLRRLDAEAARDKTGGDKDAAATPPPAKSAAERRRERIEMEQKRLADQKAEAQRVKLAREMSCQIRPVMTDAEISNCRAVWR